MFSKQVAATALVCSLILTGIGCSSAGKPATPAAAQTAAPSENPDAYKASAYIAARLAEEKVDTLFHQSTSKDGKPILNPLIATDKEKAAKYLNAYFDPALTEKILAFYLTSDKADDSLIVKKDKFFTASILKTSSKDDVTYEGTKDQVKLTTKDGAVFTVKKANEKYVVSDFAKK